MRYQLNERQANSQEISNRWKQYIKDLYNDVQQGNNIYHENCSGPSIIIEGVKQALQ